jgi:endonuclease-3 related protein
VIETSADLLLALHKLRLIEGDRYWWRNYGTWLILPEAILTQQTQWANVERSMENLFKLGLDAPEKIASAERWILAQAIAPAGFYNQKAERIALLLQKMIKDYGDFESFAENTDRQWLLACKGLGFESADSILCYGCKRAVMVVDNYTAKLLAALGREFESYDDIQDWLKSGVEGEFDRAQSELGKLGLSLELTYAYFHGLIVEFCKTQKRGAIDAAALLP